MPFRSWAARLTGVEVWFSGPNQFAKLSCGVFDVEWGGVVEPDALSATSDGFQGLIVQLSRGFVRNRKWT